VTFIQTQRGIQLACALPSPDNYSEPTPERRSRDERRRENADRISWPAQRERMIFKLEDDERFNWFYTPVPRKGLPLREMTSGQRQLALALLSAG